ncbi:phosphotransferase family protein [Gordonia hongkongensis]|uniref:Phosphotransferase family protein n=1 Tax=Gordonia hongkongensis TaxID=1701090 RepID=A0AAX3TAR4_9ACTN|nr:phosphotransferase family protein [Gordonia hongkongensis]QIK49378.1 phosphotransferase family protein [Gordonia terrae]WFP25702.1 phosphotransferase family protein [Gordonia hongkongensis]
MTTDINWDAFTEWLRDQGVGENVAEIRPLTGGTQNRVIALNVDGQSLVLRCPPPHPRASSNNAMRREIAVLSSLADTGVPHPKLVASCDDPTVMGMVFYVMEEIPGFNPGESVSPFYVSDGSARHEVGLSVARSLAHLGMVDPAQTAMTAFQKPGSFLARQVDQWSARLDSYAADTAYDPGELPNVQSMAEWLRARRPADTTPGIIHGDFHLNNVLLDNDKPTVAAIVDWEMSTIGDPLLDLGWLLVSWPQDPAPVGAGDKLGDLGGLPTRSELITAYSTISSRSVAEIDWYTALAGFKLAVVLEGTWVRSLSGQAPREVGERLHNCAIDLLGLSSRIAEGTWSVTQA